ncbi:MAG TPA: hypothetical protein VK978_00145 [Candidatus Saccharimonadales bacterium]|nr:hypothetical protein [Candidatus Saccharimonadales bacterium]
MLSEATEHRLTELEQAQNTYLPNADVAAELGEKTIVLMIGPSCIGKSTIMQEVAASDPRFAIAGTFTTREQRSDEIGKHYAYIPYTDDGIAALEDSIRQGDVVQYAVHPTTKHIYGTTIADYPNQYNLLDTLATNVKGMRRLPAKAIHTIGLVAEPAEWTAWFNQRFPEGHADRQKRRGEAVLSLAWLLEQPDGSIHWLVNGRGLKRSVAQSVINIALWDRRPTTGGSEVAERCLEAAERLPA